MTAPGASVVRGEQHVGRFTITVTFLPGTSPSRRADSAVMAATISCPPSTVTDTSAMTWPSETSVTVAGSWFQR